MKSAGSSGEQFREDVQTEYQKMHTCYFETLKTQFPDKVTARVGVAVLHPYVKRMGARRGDGGHCP